MRRETEREEETGAGGDIRTPSSKWMRESCMLTGPVNRLPFNRLTPPCVHVTLVKWNEPYQKLASCDSSGIIFVWIKYEGRWSIELINDRNTQVTDFAWSHDGRMALICYQDGFVLVGSVAGQRYWSSTLNLDRAAILCGIWAPDDHQVLFGTSNGQILVSDMHGEVVAQVTLVEDAAIVAMAWSCEKFKMEEADEEQRSEAVPPTQGDLEEGSDVND
ncbi:hypothetical protein HPB47_021384 [Ixodes persulcatus]|uniref:Uncharacterized protein n=1 Tax=Ixodes persulcatus TaxID=34615 RepID=A0AC60QCT4_IXOPE|nr:hypothetical protein HPB47_021384 [Ixodes persulcatus]